MPEIIPFHRAQCGAPEAAAVRAAMASGRLGGGGDFTRRCEEHLVRDTGSSVLLTGSCTQALEMAALLLDIAPGDEVICPSFTFVSTANAFVLRGARIVFVDVEPGSMNIDVAAVRAAITPRTRAIVPVHYAGACCDMDALMALAAERGLQVVEDAAQALGARWRGRALGSIGHFGALSFHASKSVTAGGEGGALLVNRPELQARAEILREKGTDRSRYLRGEIAHYQWLDVGSSFLMSEIQAAFLHAQLRQEAEWRAGRLSAWQFYQTQLQPLEARGLLQRPQPHADAAHNAHSWFLRVPERRDALLAHCRARGIEAATHFPPLHASPAGQRYGRFHGEDRHTSAGSAALLRLPLWPGIGEERQARVCAAVTEFFAG